MNAPACTDRSSHRLIWMKRLNGYACQWCEWNFDPRADEWTRGPLTETQTSLPIGQAT